MLERRKGFAIMLVLMMLFLLFMLGVAFFFSAWTHAFMARNYLNMKRAFVVAEGGVQTAMGAIIGDFAWAMHAQNKPVDYNWRYWGNDPHEDRTSEDCIKESRGVPVEYALNPSYALLDEDGKPRKITIFGKEVGLSGVMDPGGGAYGINSDIYHLKVMECSAQLYINEGLGHPYNTAVMQRILNNLGKQLESDIDDLGTRIMEKRPAHGYSLKSELLTLDVLTREEYDTVKDFLCTHTWSDPKVCNPVPLSWEARDAYEPELYQTRPRLPDGSALTRYGRGKKNLPGYPRNHDPLLFADQTPNLGEAIVYGYQELNPCWIEITSRAPVNINTAPKEILVALLVDLQGFFVMPQLRYHTYYLFPLDAYPHLFGYPAKSQSIDLLTVGNVHGELGVIFRTPRITQHVAGELATRIIKYRNRQPFRTWAQFNRFIDELVDAGIFSDERDFNILEASQGPEIYHRLSWAKHKHFAIQAIADMIKANFNPNLHLNETNPDANLWGWVDKTDLVTNSTEFCFLPTGYFEIESVGQILRAEWEDGKFHISPYLLIMKDSFTHNNQIMGQRRLKVEVKLWDLYRQTTQHDFMQGSYSRNNSQFVTNGNWACESGPEPVNGWGSFENEYEGYITLSTFGGSLPYDQTRVKGKLYRTDRITPIADACEPDNDPPTTYALMHAHYDFDFSLHTCKAGNQHREPLSEFGVADWTEEGRGYVSPYCAVHDPERYRIARSYRWREGLQGELISPLDHRRDGWYAERFAQLAYYSKDGNFPIPSDYPDNYMGFQRGAISYWVKPGFHPALNGYNRFLSSISKGEGEVGNRASVPEFHNLIGWQSYIWVAFPSDFLTFATEETTYLLYGQMRPHSVMFHWASAEKHLGGMDTLHWYTTPTLNHLWHHLGDGPLGPEPYYSQLPAWQRHDPDPHLCPNLILAHRWVHVTVAWNIDFRGRLDGNFITEGEIYLNGRSLARQDKYGYPGKRTRLVDFTTDSEGGLNPFWLGGSRWTRSPAHSTIDEFYLTSDYEIKEFKKQLCSYCKGVGRIAHEICKGSEHHQCPECNGVGYIAGIYPEPNQVTIEEITCPKCRGWGFRWCRWCGFRGARPYSCWACPRTGKIVNPLTGETVVCPICDGKKWIWIVCPLCKGTVKCQTCGGDGKVASAGTPPLRCYLCRNDKRWYVTLGLVKCRTIDIWSYSACGGSVKCPRCDGTGITAGNVIDEISTGVTFVEEAIHLWRHGRYYRQNDAEFTSQEIDLAGLIERVVTGPNYVKDPYGGDRWRDAEGLIEHQTREWLKRTWYSPLVKILGVSWTGYTREVMDHKDTEQGMPARWLNAQLELSLERKGKDGWVQVAGPWLNHDAGWAPVFVQLPRYQSKIRYHVRFNTRCDPGNAILLETPVLDDVTIYYATRPQVLTWVESY